MALSLPTPPPATPGPPDWADIEARASRAVMHLRAALPDIRAIAQCYGDEFGCLARPAQIELRTRHAWASLALLRDRARGHLHERERSRARADATPLWLVGKDVQELDTGRLPPPAHPPELPAPRITRGPYTGRMKLFGEPGA